MQAPNTTSSTSSTKKNQAIPFLRANQTTPQLTVRDWPYPEFKANELIIRVYAFGVNFADVVARKGQYDAAPPFPFVPGYEVAGIVVEKGSEVTRFEIGDRVAALTAFGGYSRYAVAQNEGVTKIPKEWTFVQAASIPVSYLTAYYALHMTGPVRPGDRVLIHACAGALGQACTQLALASKCEVFGTCGSDEKAKLLKEKGIQHVINYRTHDFETEVKRLTNNEGVDITIDSVGGSYFKKDFNITRPCGRVVGVGASAMTDRSFSKMFSLIPQVLSMISLSSIDMMLNSKSFCGVNMKIVADKKPKVLEYCWNEVIENFTSGKLSFEPATELPWTEIGKALDQLEHRQTTGKIVLLIPEDEEEKSQEQKELKEN